MILVVRMNEVLHDNERIMSIFYNILTSQASKKNFRTKL